jgi:hypothetical protein
MRQPAIQRPAWLRGGSETDAGPGAGGPEASETPDDPVGASLALEEPSAALGVSMKDLPVEAG